MPGPNFVLDKGFILDSDLPVRKYRAVVKNGGVENCAEVTVAGARVLGISQERVDDGDELVHPHINIRLLGISRCIAGAAVADGARVSADAQGRAITAGVGAVPFGVAMYAAAAAGDHFDVLLTPGLPAA